MYNDDVLSKLKTLSNTIKHKHLIRIKNDGDTLWFDDFTIKYQNKNIIISNQNVKEFIIETHNILIPNLLGLYTQIMNAKKKKLSNLK